MAKKSLKEQFSDLNVLLKKAKDIGQPAGMDYRLKWLTDRDFRKKLFEENPRCYVTIRTATGNDIPLIPTCNRTALDHPKMIGVAIQIASSMIGHRNVDQDHLGEVLSKLMGMKD